MDDEIKVRVEAEAAAQRVAPLIVMKPQIVRCAFQLRNLRLRDLVGTGKVRRRKVHEGPFRLLP